ncbi:unnamed protein product [Parnassius apollo]|uniref:(apollo) hypothetical protein n=1 Tax=Parnassius apollo TaxID=110799 RepID=A0A8S3XQZ9_PARAO|nr:unnamed protein product [Parnassius apollo]
MIFKEKIGKEVSDEIIESEDKKEQDKGYEISGAAFDSIIIPLDKDLLSDLNNFEEICDNLEVLDEKDVNVDDSKHKITNRKRNCIQEEKWEIKALKIPKLNTEKENIFPINQTKSIRNVVSRHSECHKCKIRTSLQLMKKFIACKKFVCFTCDSWIIPKYCYNDFICDICFGE